MKTKIMLTVGLMALLVVAYGFGQRPALKVKIEFPFTVAGKVLPAGQYQFERDDAGQFFRVTSEAKNSAMALIITRLAGAMHTTQGDSHFVFDVVGESYLLSEIWIPGEDGYMLASTKDKHDHKVLDLKR